MTWAVILSFSAFAFVSSITPGPNNLMLMASGANFGFRATAPHFLGIQVGFFVMVVLVGLGLAGLFAAFPWLYDVLRWGGALYLLYLAYKIATADGLGAGASSARPQTFFQAVAFQWVNPKAWTMAVVSLTAFTPTDQPIVNVMVIAVLFLIVGLPCSVVWMAFGVGLKRFLDQPRALRIFNVTMAVLLVASLYPLVQDAPKF